MSDRKTPPFDTQLAARTAEMLALPQLVCRRRKCRRGNACRWHFKSNNEPCCLFNLTAGERREFDTMMELARVIRAHGGWNSLIYLSLDPDQRLLEDAGVEIAGSAVSRSDAKRWNAFRRDREKRRNEPQPTWQELLKAMGYSAAGY